MALIFFVLWIIWAIQANGVGGFMMHIFGPKGETPAFLKILMVVIFFMVGWLEIVSILFRPISLSFRLFGNMFTRAKTCSNRCRGLVPIVSPG